jgi:hypothetical protein
LISGFIKRVPTMHEHDGHHRCELVLAHTIYSELDEDWHRAFSPSASGTSWLWVCR